VAEKSDDGDPSPSPILESPEHQCIAVIGAGSWGTTLAQLLAEKGKDVRLWVREPHVCEALRRDRINHTFLRDYGCLPDHLQLRNSRWPWMARWS